METTGRKFLAGKRSAWRTQPESLFSKMEPVRSGRRFFQRGASQTGFDIISSTPRCRAGYGLHELCASLWVSRGECLNGARLSVQSGVLGLVQLLGFLNFSVMRLLSPMAVKSARLVSLIL